MGFWLFVAIIIILVLVARRGNSSDNRYAEGYWDGYRALGEKIRDELANDKLDVDKVRAYIDFGFTGDAVASSASDEVASEDDEVVESNVVTRVSEPQAVVEQTIAGWWQNKKAPTPQQDDVRSLRNLNILLFMGSLLLVAAAAAFIATAMPDGVKLVSVWLLVAGFYAAGIALLSSTKVRPAAVAFLGTGLGILPFAGLALHQYTDVSAAGAWAFTSVIGVVAYFYAALALKSQVVSYLTLGFVISLAASSSDALSMPLVLSFVCIILVALVLTLVAHLRPTWVPQVFAEPIEKTGQFVTPVALVASLVVFDRMSLLSYIIVFGVATLHYIVAWLQARTLTFALAARILGHVALLLTGYDVLDTFMLDKKYFALIWLAVATAHLAFALFMLARHKSDQVRTGVERTMYVVMTVLQFVALGIWTSHDGQAAFYTLTLLLIGVGSLSLAIITRQVGAAVLGLGVSLILPSVALGSMLELPVVWQVGWFLLASSVALYGYWMTHTHQRSQSLRVFMTAAYLVYWLMALLLSFLCASWVLTVVLFVGGVLFYVLSYLETSVTTVATGLAWTFLSLGIIRLWWHGEVGLDWATVNGLLTTAVVSYGVSFIHKGLGDSTRRIILAAVTVFVLLIARVASELLPDAWRVVGLVWLVLAMIQAVYSLYVLWRLPLGQRTQSNEVMWLIAAVIAQVSSVLMWWNDDLRAELSLLSLGLATLTLIVTSFTLRTVLSAYAALALSFTLPLILFNGVLDYTGFVASVICFAVLTIVCFSARIIQASRSANVRQFWLIAYVLYYILAFGLAYIDHDAPRWIATTILLTGFGLAYCGSYIEKLPMATLCGWAAALWGVGRLLSPHFSVEWTQVYAPVIVAVVAYIAYIVHYKLRDQARRVIAIAVVWGTLGWALLISAMIPAADYWVPGLLLAISATVAIEGVIRRNNLMIEVALYGATLGLQRLVNLTADQLNVVFYTHWWAVTIAATAWWRGDRALRFMVAVGLMTASTGIYALGEGGLYSLLFLIEHLVLLVVGAIHSARWAIWWGLIASSLAVLYFLRDITFLAFAFLGILLISIVIWRLLRASKSHE